MDNEEKYYLKMAGGKVFGPVDMVTLCKWASDGRVEPSACVSRDREEWVRATDVPELDMEWVVENRPGQFYGPTHRAVIDDFIKSGALVPTARFYRDMRSGLAERADAEAAANETACRLAARERELEAATVALAAAEERNAGFKAEQTRFEAERQRFESEAAVYRRELDSARREIGVSKDELENARRELDAVKAEIASEKQELGVAREDLAVARRDLNEKSQELEKARKELEELRAERKAEAAEVLVPEVMVAGEPPRASNAFAKPVAVERPTAAAKPSFGAGASPFGGGGPTSLADLERAAQAELARMRASGAKGFFFGRKK